METSTWKRIIRVERAVVAVVAYLNSQPSTEPELLEELLKEIKPLLQDVEQLR